MSFARILLVLVSALYLSACAGPLKSVAYDRDARAAGDTIIVLRMLETEVRHTVLNNPANSFGLIGASIAAGVELSRQRHLQGQIPEFEINEFFQQQLALALAEREYYVVTMNPASFTRTRQGSTELTPRELQTDARGLRKFSVANEDGYAQLDVALSFVGYAASGVGASSPYRPTVQAHVRLSDADGKTILFQDSFAYHNIFGSAQMITLEPHADHVYPTWEGLRDADGGALRIELEEALSAVARMIAQQL